MYADWNVVRFDVDGFAVRLCAGCGKDSRSPHNQEAFVNPCHTQRTSRLWRLSKRTRLS